MRLRALLAAIVMSLVVVAPVLADWPVPGGTISQGFSSTHKGVDISAPRGTPVHPVMYGRVAFAGWQDNCGGWQVYVEMADGRYSAYYHLNSRPPVSRGQRVRYAAVIGYVGTSGTPPPGVSMTCSTGPHLHLEAWRGYPWASGSRVLDPTGYLDANDPVELPVGRAVVGRAPAPTSTVITRRVEPTVADAPPVPLHVTVPSRGAVEPLFRVALHLYRM